MNMISYEGIGEVAVTIRVDSALKVGMVVRMEENDQACPCMGGEDFCGVLLNRNGDYGCVQVKGFVTVRFSGDLAPGWVNLVSNGVGGVRAFDSGMRTLVTHVDNNAKTAVICL